MSRNISKYLFKDENSSTNIFKIHKRFWPAGTKFGPHWHDYLELEIIVSGTAKHNYNSTSYLIEPGSAYIISYYDFHEIEAITDMVFFCIQFNNDFLDREITEYLSSNSVLYHFNAEEMEKVTQQINELFAEQDSSLPFRDLYIKSILSEIILRMIRKTALQKTLSTPLPIQQVIAYIADNYLQKITLEDIAHKFAFSSNYLGKLFKTQTGYTFNEYLNLSRLKHACNLLQQTALPVKEISYQSGYSSVECFLYIFKKNLQMTPSEYRQLFQATANDTLQTMEKQ